MGSPAKAAPFGQAVLGYRDSIALARQWQGSPAAPLDSDGMWRTIADLLRPYRCNQCISDEWAADPELPMETG